MNGEKLGLDPSTWLVMVNSSAGLACFNLLSIFFSVVVVKKEKDWLPSIVFLRRSKPIIARPCLLACSWDPCSCFITLLETKPTHINRVLLPPLIATRQRPALRTRPIYRTIKTLPPKPADAACGSEFTAGEVLRGDYLRRR